VANKTIEYIFGLVIFIFIMFIWVKWAAYVVVKEDWLVFIAGFIFIWLVIYIVFGRKEK